MRVARLAEIEAVPIPDQNGLLWAPVRHTLGIEAFGISAYTAERAGQQVVDDHDELGGGAGHHEELYVVVSGRAMCYEALAGDREAALGHLTKAVELDETLRRHAQTDIHLASLRDDSGFPKEVT